MDPLYGLFLGFLGSVSAASYIGCVGRCGLLFSAEAALISWAHLVGFSTASIGVPALTDGNSGVTGPTCVKSIPRPSTRVRVLAPIFG